MATLAQCKKAIDTHEEELSRHKNVVGLGIVPLDDGAPGYAVAVYVEKQFRGKSRSVPEVLKIPSRKGEVEVPVRVIVQGPDPARAQCGEDLVIAEASAGLEGHCSLNDVSAEIFDSGKSGGPGIAQPSELPRK